MSDSPKVPTTYQHITIYPADINGSQEVWAEWEEAHPKTGEMIGDDTIIGYLYHPPIWWGGFDDPPNAYVWLCPYGHPTYCFLSKDILSQWLLTQCVTLTWATEPKT
jgi:hypothetical protein